MRDRMIPAEAAIVPPELDPDGIELDPDDPDSRDIEFEDWPEWTENHRYTETRHAEGGRT